MQKAQDSHVETISPPLLSDASPATIGVEAEKQKKQQRATFPAPTLHHARSSTAENPILHYEGYDANGHNSTVPCYQLNGTSKKARMQQVGQLRDTHTTSTDSATTSVDRAQERIEQVQETSHHPDDGRLREPGLQSMQRSHPGLKPTTSPTPFRGMPAPVGPTAMARDYHQFPQSRSTSNAPAEATRPQRNSHLRPSALQFSTGSHQIHHFGSCDPDQSLESPLVPTEDTGMDANHYWRLENERLQQEKANLTKESEDMRGLWQAALERETAMRERVNALADEIIRLRSKSRDAGTEMKQA